MAGRPYVLAETTWKTVRQTGYDVAILPWGATEAHNFHLPYCTDVIEAEQIAIESARLAWEQQAKVVVLPTIPFGVNSQQLDFPLVINMNPATQASLLADVIDSVQRHSIRKLVILNMHGGNDFRQMIRVLQEANELFLGWSTDFRSSLGKITSTHPAIMRMRWKRACSCISPLIWCFPCRKPAAARVGSFGWKP